MKTFKNKVLGGVAIIMMGFIAACSIPMNLGGLSSADSKSNSGPAAPLLGSAASFAVFGGGAGITNQGTLTSITGDMGTTGASTMITGFHSSSFSYAETPLNVGAVIGNVYTNAPQGSPRTSHLRPPPPLMRWWPSTTWPHAPTASIRVQGSPAADYPAAPIHQDVVCVNQAFLQMAFQVLDAAGNKLGMVGVIAVQDGNVARLGRGQA